MTLAIALLPLLIASWIGEVTSDFNVLMVVHWNGRPFNHYSSVREFALNIIKEKKQRLGEKESLDSVDLLSRILSSGHSDENFMTNIVISFIIAGCDTTLAALTWFFWLLSKNPEIESEILNEINEKSEVPVFDEFIQYYKGFELLRRWMMKHHSQAMDFSNLDFEAIDTEVLVDEAKE
ncbi:hypothetical protein SO802_021394 [Lithocarpus litseifolius]|uniref:Cytochrome P450 n=1 Tax=Lithocarpus litseifolius TaxID=425828 RepID=A0AAW2CGV6_9ROSI